MTPNAYLDRIRELVAGGQYAEALAFADGHADVVSPPLSVFQIVEASDTLHIAAMVVGMEEYAARDQEAGPADVAQ